MTKIRIGILSFLLLVPLYSWLHPVRAFPKDILRFGVGGLVNAVKPEFVGALNAQIVRVEVFWGKVEPERGKYLITEEVLKVIDKTVPNGADLLLSIQINNPWGTTGPWTNMEEFLKEYSANHIYYPPKNYDDFRNFIKVLGDSLKGKVKYYQLANEPDLIRPENGKRWWAGTAAEFIELVKVTNAALKSADPNAYLVLGGFAMGWDSNANKPSGGNFIREVVLGSKDYVDAFDVHHYGEYSRLYGKIRYLRELGKKPVWITEMGAPSFDRIKNATVGMDPFFDELKENASLMSPKMMEDSIMAVIRVTHPDFILLPENRSQLEKIKAEDLTKLYAIAFAEDAAMAFWFQIMKYKVPVWYNNRPDEMTPRTFDSVYKFRSTEFGLIDAGSGERLPAFYAYRLLVEKISSFSNIKSLGNENSVVYEFQFPSGDKKYICWSNKGQQSLELKVPDGEYQATKIITEMGQTDPSITKLGAQGGKLMLELDSTPIIIETTK